jgi:hypothetical protein
MTLTSRAHCLPIPTSVSLKLHTASVSHQRPSTGTSLLHEPRMPRTLERISKNITRVLLFAFIMTWHVSTVRAQYGWMCTVDDSVGYRYDTKQQTWKAANFNPGANIIVRPPREEDIKVFPDALSQVYVVVLQLSRTSRILITTCPYISDSYGLMVCHNDREPLQIFSINTHQLRMESYYSGSYLVDQNDPNSPVAGSSLSIGRCHSL